MPATEQLSRSGTNGLGWTPDDHFTPGRRNHDR